MRFIYGHGWTHLSNDTDGEGDGNGDAGGAAAGDDGAAGGADDEAGADAGADDADADAAAADGAAGAAGADAGKPKDMLAAITQGLAKTAPKVDDAAAAEAAAKKQADDAAAAAAAGQTDKHQNGAPKKDAKGNELDDKGVIVKPAVAPKVKTAAELDLKPEERKALGTKAQARFGEMVTTLKARETEIATLNETIKPLREARDTITSILQETKTTPDQLSAYLEFNRMLQSGDPKDLESALGMIEGQRNALYKALGREPSDGGVDLLAEFPDLQEKVAEAKITREDALELANGRRAQAAAAARDKQQRASAQTAEQHKKAQNDALAAITAWTTDLSKTDIDYKAKEDKLLEQVEEVIKNYPPDKWVATLKLLYSGLVIPKAAAAAPKEKQPIRPSGARPGAKAPQNMFEAMWGAEAPK
jgi:hypothetical protein